MSFEAHSFALLQLQLPFAQRIEELFSLQFQKGWIAQVPVPSVPA
jgi:hypothetical protein